MKIRDIKAREILDSRGTPTVAAELKRLFLRELRQEAGKPLSLEMVIQKGIWARVSLRLWAMSMMLLLLL